MGTRPKLKKIPAPHPTPTGSSYRLRPIDATPKRRKKADDPLIVLPNRRLLTQNPMLPRLPGQLGFTGDKPVTEEEISRAGEVNQIVNTNSLMHEAHRDTEIPLPSKHRLKRLKQSLTWTSEVIPKLISPYLELQRKTQSLRHDGKLVLEGQRCECCPQSRLLKLWVVRFSSKSFDLLGLPVVFTSNIQSMNKLSFGHQLVDLHLYNLSRVVYSLALLSTPLLQLISAYLILSDVSSFELHPITLHSAAQLPTFWVHKAITSLAKILCIVTSLTLCSGL